MAALRAKKKKKSCKNSFFKTFEISIIIKHVYSLLKIYAITDLPRGLGLKFSVLFLQNILPFWNFLGSFKRSASKAKNRLRFEEILWNYTMKYEFYNCIFFLKLHDLSAKLSANLRSRSANFWCAHAHPWIYERRSRSDKMSVRLPMNEYGPNQNFVTKKLVPWNHSNIKY